MDWCLEGQMRRSMEAGGVKGQISLLRSTGGSTASAGGCETADVLCCNQARARALAGA